MAKEQPKRKPPISPTPEARDNEILKRLGNGLRISEIAADLGISARAVETALYRQRRKRNARTLAHLAVMIERDKTASEAE